ncbi:cathepsin [Nesidiocoris tenuis]|uniref:Cathepsin n=1 Tax=Nesidiocoris tenuis TaxID=355587 RepID=A0ABN7B5P2_9HEMI|nr:cathepsin [Nesidiocoris tenuis]BES99579.1 cathepsin [Nesidiocoris tenuis]
MKIIIALACVLAVGLTMPTDNDAEWENFKRTYGKNYGNADSESMRRNIYFQNKDKVAEHNELYKKGLVSYGVKINGLADLLPHEAAKMLNGYRKGTPSNEPRETYKPSGNSLPASTDWRSKNAVTPIKNQGQCGSCWAFSTTGSLEGQWALKKGKLISLSEQQLVDCSGNYGNDGCEGGLMDQAFQYIKANGGLDTESSYPYTGEDDSCAFNKKNVAATVTGYVDIPTGNEAALQDASANIGPISVAIDASNWSFQLYAEGVYNEPDCSSTSLDHGVLVVGYGSDSGSDYWLVKNSWGTDWGINGYIKMSRNKNNQCGIATQASYPLV